MAERSRLEIREKLKAFLEKEDAIASAFLFGSFVHGPFSAESDLDIGILYSGKKTPDPERIFDLNARLSDLIGMNVDLICLNRVSPILRMQVFKKGEKLFDRNPRETQEYFIKLINDYDDLKRVRKPIEEQILNGRIYGR